MTFNVSGKIVRTFDKKSGVSQAGKEWASQDFLIQEQGSENVLFFNVFGEENIANFNLREGADVSLILDARSREWNGKYFTELRCKQCFAATGTSRVSTVKKQENFPPVEDAPF
jgi:hypothetical protein